MFVYKQCFNPFKMNVLSERIYKKKIVHHKRYKYLNTCKVEPFDYLYEYLFGKKNYKLTFWGGCVTFGISFEKKITNFHHYPQHLFNHCVP